MIDALKRQKTTMDFEIFKKIAEQAYQTLPMCYTLEECLDVFRCFFDAYKLHRGEEHPPLKAEQIKKLMVKMQYLNDRTSSLPDIDSNEYPDLIELYFETKFGLRCNYRINHFFSGDIRELKLHERERT